MNIIESIRIEASKRFKNIVLPRSSDQRVIKAAEYLQEHKLCNPILLQNGVKIKTDLELVSINDHPRLEAYASAFYERRKHKGVDYNKALEIVKDPLFFASSMLAHGDADGGVAGSISTTGDVLRAAIQTIGLKKGSKVVSSTFLMSFDDGRVFTYGDCGVVPYPDSVQLASIAVDSADTHYKLTGIEPKVAMLSFSTMGSAKHERVELVTDALKLAKAQKPGLDIDGELQFDAAYVSSVGERKAPESKVAGHANVFIFPNLDAGNISYKITERLGGLLQRGQLSRG